MPAFDFVAEYRAMQPSADRDQITARNASFDKAVADSDDTMARVVDLAYFAYRLPIATAGDSAQWFGEIMRANDATFSLELDAEEAARIATLVLRRRLEASFYTTPVVVHAASFGGKRPTVDKHALSMASKHALADIVRRRGSSITRPNVTAGKPATTVPDLIKEMKDTDVAADAPLLEALVDDYKAQIKQVVTTANKVVETAWAENRRLAEEIDLLWWHLGNHSHLLDCPLSDIPAPLRPVVIGMDVGEMINAAPGPYGTYGIIRKALGDAAGETFKLGDAVKELSNGHFADLMSKSPTRYALVPIHAVFGDVLVDRTPVVATQFKRLTGLALDVKLTGYELAVQAYHERILHKSGHA